MKKSLALSSLVLAAALALTGCTGGGSTSSAPDGSSAPLPSATAHSAAQVKDLGGAVAYALTLTPYTPDALGQIDQTGKLIKQYTDASSTLSPEQKAATDGFIATSQQAVQQKNVTDAGGNLTTAARGLQQALADN